MARQEAAWSRTVGGEESASLARRLARWWAVREAGGLYQVLRQMPEALPAAEPGSVTQIAGPLAAKAGLRLSTWSRSGCCENGTEVVLRIPPQRGLKYLAAQAVQAGVGVVGFQKMEEHLSSRPPRALLNRIELTAVTLCDELPEEHIQQSRPARRIALVNREMPLCRRVVRYARI